MKTNYSPEVDEIEIFYSPTKALGRMGDVYEMEGIDTGTTSSTFQSVREAWAAAVFLLGYSQITKGQYWLNENPNKNLSPDIFAVAFSQVEFNGKKAVSREILEVEVCEYDEHAETSLPDHLKTKLKNKQYNPSSFLLCYLHPGEGKEIKLSDVIKDIQDIKTTVREIWVLLHRKDKSAGNFVISRIYWEGKDLDDIVLHYEGDYLKLSTIPQTDMLQPSRGSAEKVEFNMLGYGYVPLPRIKKKKKGKDEK